MSAIIACCDWSDVAVAECHVSALACAPLGTPFVPVQTQQFSLINCAFLVRLMAERAPRGSVLIGCCDPRLPGVNRIPLGLYFAKPDLYFVGPNTGTVSMLLDQFEATTVVRLDFDDWGLDQFLGRSLFAPTSGKLIAKQKLESLGGHLYLENVTRLDIPKMTVLHIDNFGNVKLNATVADLPSHEHGCFTVNGMSATLALDFKRGDELIQDGALIIGPGSSLGMLELQLKATRPSSKGAADLLSVAIGDHVVVQ